MSAAPSPYSVAPSTRGSSLPPAGGTVSRWPAEQDPTPPPQLGPGHDVVPHPLDVQPRAQPEGGLARRRPWPLVVAHRGDPHQGRGQAEQPVGASPSVIDRRVHGHVDTPWVRRMSLSWALS